MPPDTAGFDDIYTLSIPSFEWVKMYPPDGNATGAYPHHSLTCNVIDNAQMIVVGGTFPTSDRCDVQEQYGLHNMDLGQQNGENAIWRIFDANLTKYAVPAPIINAIGGSPTGGATKTAPSSGFSNPDLRVLMTRKATIAARTPTRAIPTATDHPNDTSTPLSTGAIAGIAIGSAAALAALLTATILLIRRRRNQHNPSHGGPNNNNNPHQTKYLSTTTTTTGGGGSSSQHGWGGATQSQSHSPTSYSPTGSYPHSPFLHQHHQHGNGYHGPPAELPVPGAGAGATSWLAPDGVAYELVDAHSPPGAHLMSGSGGGGGGHTPTDVMYGGAGGSSSGGGTPRTKVDAEGRLWVQVSSPASSSHLPLPHGGGGGGGGGSPGGFGAGAGMGVVELGDRQYSPVTPGSGSGSAYPYQPHQPLQPQMQQMQQQGVWRPPQELSSEPRQDGGGSGLVGDGGGVDGGGGFGEEGSGPGSAVKKHLTFYHP